MTSIDAGVLSRARGAWLGQVAGDALGTTVEFESPARIAQRFPDGLREIVGGGPFRLRAGQVTDDTELALALARSLVAVGDYDPDHVASAYIEWYDSGPFDVGGTTRAAFGGVRPGPGAAARVAHRASRSSQANGALMRLSPLAIWGWRRAEDDLAALAAFDARLSHPNDVCQAANAVFAHALATAVREGTDPETTYARALAFARRRAACAPLVELLTEAEHQPPADYVRNMGWVRIALQNAFFQLLHAPSLEAGVVETVMQGGDTDTNACIAGALLGAVHGEGAVPEQWRAAILACRTDRGPRFQSHDAPELAALLLQGGEAPGPLPDLEAALATPVEEPEGDVLEEGDDEELAEDDFGEDLDDEAPDEDDDAHEPTEGDNEGDDDSSPGPLFR